MAKVSKHEMLKVARETLKAYKRAKELEAETGKPVNHNEIFKAWRKAYWN